MQRRERARPSVANYWIRPRVLLVLHTAKSCRWKAFKIFGDEKPERHLQKYFLYILHRNLAKPSSFSQKISCADNFTFMVRMNINNEKKASKSSLVFISKWLEMIRVGFKQKHGNKYKTKLQWFEHLIICKSIILRKSYSSLGSSNHSIPNHSNNK